MISNNGQIDFSRIGLRIRELRIKKNLTLVELAKLASISKSYLSQIENGKFTISISLLHKICLALGITLSGILSDETSFEINVIRQEDQKWIKTGLSEKVLQTCLYSDGSLIEAWIMYFQPHSIDIDNQIIHHGEENVIVLEGKIVVNMNDTDEYILKKGDILVYSAEQKHTWNNPFPDYAKVLLVHAPFE